MVGKLLPQLLLAAFPADLQGSMSAVGDEGADCSVAAAARKTLKTVLFHSINIEGRLPLLCHSTTKLLTSRYTTLMYVEMILKRNSMDGRMQYMERYFRLWMCYLSCSAQASLRLPWQN